jgi:hypothetical protein
MPELFDMIAGSETGAVIATSLVLPNDDEATKATQPNKYFATTAKEFFEKNSDVLYHDRQMPNALKIVVTLLFCGVICAFVYFGTEKVYHIDGFSERVDEIRVLIKLRKKIAKGKQIDGDYEERLRQVLSSLYENSQNLISTAIDKQSIVNQQKFKLNDIYCEVQNAC